MVLCSDRCCFGGCWNQELQSVCLCAFEGPGPACEVTHRKACLYTNPGHAHLSGTFAVSLSFNATVHTAWIFYTIRRRPPRPNSLSLSSSILPSINPSCMLGMGGGTEIHGNHHHNLSEWRCKYEAIEQPGCETALRHVRGMASRAPAEAVEEALPS